MNSCVDTSLFESQIESGRIHDVPAFVTALWDLRRENRHAAAWELADRSLALLPDDPGLRDVTAMIFYDLRIKSLTDDTDVPTCARLFAESQRFRAVPTDSGGVFGKIYSYRLIALRLSKIVVEKDAGLALRMLESLVVGALQMERRPFLGSGDSHSKLRPSDLDSYYLRLTKALELLGRWEEILNVEEAAIRALEGSDNQQWILLRLAKAALELNNVAKAKEFASHRSVNPHSPYWKSITARIQQGQGDSASAIESLKSLIGSQRDLSYQVKNLAQLAVLMAEVDVTIADSLTKLEAAIRVKNSWSIRGDLKERLNKVTTPDSNLWDEQRLRAWMTARSSVSTGPRLTGVVVRHLDNGFSGFIRKDQGGEIYYARSKGSNEALHPVGTRVSFLVQPSFDRKKNRDSERAVDIRMI